MVVLAKMDRMMDTLARLETSRPGPLPGSLKKKTSTAYGHDDHV